MTCERCGTEIPPDVALGDDDDVYCAACAEQMDIDKQSLREEFLRDMAEDRALEAYLERRRGIV